VFGGQSYPSIKSISLASLFSNKILNKILVHFMFTCLNEKQLWLSSQRWALVCGECTPQNFRFVRCILGVQNLILAVGQNYDDYTIAILVIHFGSCEQKAQIVNLFNS
jgi:hypothetical protein